MGALAGKSARRQRDLLQGHGGGKQNASLAQIIRSLRTNDGPGCARCGRSENVFRTRQFDRRVRSATSRSDASASDCVRAALRTTAGVCEPRASRQTGASNDGHL
jgi:hypothetical protein